MGQLSYLIGTFECQGEVLATPLSAQALVRRKLTTRLDLDGHWLFMRIDEAETPDRPHPVSGNWQITYDRAKECFVSLWSDGLGRWAVQTCPGWEDDSLTFTGDILVGDKQGSVRDILVRRGAFEMLFLVEFQVYGEWTRYLETICRRTG
jgi:hypothetical protein